MSDLKAIAKQALLDAIDAVKTQTALAKKIGCTQGYISRRLAENKPLGANYCRKCEEVTGIPKERLNPMVFGDGSAQ